MLPTELLDDADRPGLRASKEGGQASGPFISFYTPQEMLALAREAGFKGSRHVSGDLLAERYFADRTDGLRPVKRRRPAAGHHLTLVNAVCSKKPPSLAVQKHLLSSASTTSSARRLGSSGPAQPTRTGRLRGAAGVFPADSCAASIRSAARPGRHLEIRGLEPTGHRRCPTAKACRCRPVFEHP